MKKFRKITALLLSLAIMVVMQANVLGISFEEKTSNVPSLESVTISNGNASAGQIVLENEKYIFVAQGVAPQFVRNGAVLIYSKQTGELLKTITQLSSSKAWHCPVRDMVLADDVLVVSWGHNVSISEGAITQVLRIEGNIQSPVVAYDVSEVKADEELTKIQIDSGNEYGAKYYPYIWGGILYFDADKEIVYTSRYSRDFNKYYRGFNLSDIKASLVSGEAPTASEIFSTSTATFSENSAQFIVKDGWLYEVLLDNGGLVGVTATDTLTTNNVVNVFNLNGLDLSKRKAVSGYLKGTYTTEIAGDAVINDIEIIGDYMYVATTEGIEVVSLAPAKAEGLEEAVVLEKTTTLSNETAGSVMDLELSGSALYAACSGAEVYAELEAETHSDGAVVIYDVTSPEKAALTNTLTVSYGAADVSVDEFKKNVYVLCDTRVTPVMKVLSYAGEAPSFESEVILEDSKDTSFELTYAAKSTAGQIVAENEKYVFVAQGIASNGFEAQGAVRIYDKATGEILNTLSLYSTKNHYTPIRNMWLYDDVLYVSYGNRIDYSEGAIGTANRASEADAEEGTNLIINTTSKRQSPFVAYDVETVTADAKPQGLVLDYGHAYGVKHYPYVKGHNSYLAEEDGLIYVSKVTNASYSRREYVSFNLADVKNAIAQGSADSVGKLKFHTTGLSMNTSQFIIKDGWLFEVLKDNEGLSGVTATDSLVDSEGVQLNNTIRVYNLNNAEITSSTKTVASYLKGIYTTEVAGDDVINDIEVYGDYMYVATTEGIEVVSLAPAKAEEITSETAVVLESVNTIGKDGIGEVMDMEISEDLLYAGYSGAEIYPASGTVQSDGALVVYSLKAPELPVEAASETVSNGVANIEVNSEDGKVYMINDTIGTSTDAIGNISICNLSIVPIKFVSDGKTASELTPGTYDISMDVVNPDSESGTIILALYSGNRLADVITVPCDKAGTVTICEGFEIESEITKVKVMYVNSLEGIASLTEAAVMER